MVSKLHGLEIGCGKCCNRWDQFNITMAFQPIIDIESKRVFAHEALVRGSNGETASTILAGINDDNIHSFDQLCRATAIRIASELRVESLLSINFLPNAVYNPVNCLRTTLAAAEKYKFPKERLLFEVTESEEISDRRHLANIIEEYRALGIGVAIDDFGAGHSGLNLLADINPDVVKLDRFLIIDIDRNRRKQAIVRAIVGLCAEMNSAVVCEGIETRNEYLALRDLGVKLVQGYYFARPAFEALAPVDFSLAG